MDVDRSRTTVPVVKDKLGEKCQTIFRNFLESFTGEDEFEGELKYLKLAQELKLPERNTLHVSFRDVVKYNHDFASTIQEEYYRVYPYLCNALSNFAKDRIFEKFKKDFYVGFVDVPTKHKLRQLTSNLIGSLIRINGQVVRTHPVHPELISGTFTCLDCRTVIKDVKQEFRYTEPTICTNESCNNRSRFLLDLNQSHFVDFQRVRIQETQAELPRGNIPRSIEIILRAEAVETTQPGDRSDFTGTLIVVPDVSQLATADMRTQTLSRRKGTDGFETDGVKGLKALGVRELSYKFLFLGCSVRLSDHRITAVVPNASMKKVQANLLEKDLSGVEWERIYNMAGDANIFGNLTKSLFPTIHGNEQLKKGILLMLFGGVPKVTKEKTTLRGDINICIVGDPSTAKSQFLKQVSEFLPRAVYTSGKASTAAGLTAAVVRDEESGEFVIEAGALMLADNGVCCIDEFDKMDLKDQVAIHEAMEQQTISIAKAGVKATLNARSSILAAANPIGGHYDRAKSLKQNISLSAPIMSRFDLFYVLVDERNEITDYSIARTIVDLHMNSKDIVERVYPLDDIFKYVQFARHFKPKLTPSALKLVIEMYTHLRQRDAGATKSSWRITVRQLESLIRLSESVARMHLTEEIEDSHVTEAYRLLSRSMIRVVQPAIQLFEEDDELMEIESQVAASNGPTNNEAEVNGESNPLANKEKALQITVEEYKNISNLLIQRLQEEEAKCDESEGEGMKKSDLVNWYLKQVEFQIENEADLIKKTSIVEKIIYRLIHNEQVLIPLLKPGQTEEEQTEDPILVVHPNFVSERS